MQEEVLLKQYRTGTTVTFFSVHLPLDSSDGIEKFPAVMFCDNYGNAQYLKTFDGKELWMLNSENNNVYYDINTMPNIITGVCYFDRYERVLDNYKQQNIRNNFLFYIKGLTSGTTSNTFVLFSNEDYDDFFVNIKIERTYDILNTLNVENTTTDTFPTQNANTGIVFGRLDAVQKIKDENGKFIKIPLKFVPIAIFNTSESFPDVSSIDENGNRIRLNIKRLDDNNNILYPQQVEYTNNQSYVTDIDYLQDVGYVSQIPEQYKYTTTTNENGEFVLFNIPVGTQTLMFEVDLLKQGLTHDEIALNFYPYPASKDVPVDNVPHYFFRQFPITVVPSWGDFQTGYTETNISVNLDLRKWTTYYIPPISAGGLSIPQRLASDAAPMSIEVRDMTKIFNENNVPNINPPAIEMVEIHDVANRVSDQYIEWYSEIAQRKNKLIFRGDTIFAFKLPANIYDPNGYRTNTSGETVNNIYNKGVWLSAYELKIYYKDKKTTFKSTGHEHVWDASLNGGSGGYISRDHFDLNFNIPMTNQPGNTPNGLMSEDVKNDGIYNFPYEKNWSVNYPEKYSIPSIPKEINPEWAPSSYIERPKYLDGDMIGELLPNDSSTQMLFEKGVGGNGAIYNGSTGYWDVEEIANYVSKGLIYKYEGLYGWDDFYANGYHVLSAINSFNMVYASTVKNGEKYQRLECGYGYFLRPDGWPRISQSSTGELMSYADSKIYMSDPSVTSFVVTPTEYSANNTNPNYKPYSAQNYEIGFDFTQAVNDLGGIPTRQTKLFIPMDGKGIYSVGAMRIYRVVNPTTQNLIDPFVPITPRYVTLKFGELFVQRGDPNGLSQMAITSYHHPSQAATGQNEDQFERIDSPYTYGTPANLKLLVHNTGTDTLRVTCDLTGVYKDIAPQAFETFTYSDVGNQWNNLSLTLNANSNFVKTANSSYFTKTKARITFDNVTYYRGNGILTINTNTILLTNSDIILDATPSPTNYYLISKNNNIKVSNACVNDNNSNDIQEVRWVAINGFLFTNSDSIRVSEQFSTTPVDSSYASPCTYAWDSSTYYWYLP